MSEERYFANIREIKVSTMESEANELLNKGYELLKIVDGRIEKRDNAGTIEVVPTIMFVLGRGAQPKPIEKPADNVVQNQPEKPASQESAPEGEKKSAPVEQHLAEGVLWNIKNDSYSWAYVKDLQGNTTPEKQALLDKISQAKGEYHSGGYVYSVSPDGKFLRRAKEKN